MKWQNRKTGLLLALLLAVSMILSACSETDITESQRDIISDEVRSVAEQQKDIVENGFIEETISSTIVTVCWTVGELKQ